MARYFGVGKNWKKGPGGIPRKREDADLIADALAMIFSTRRGERVMRPNFGSIFLDLVFENNDPLLLVRVRREIRRLFTQFESRAKLISVEIRQEDTKLFADIVFDPGGAPETLSIPLNGG